MDEDSGLKVKGLWFMVYCLGLWFRGLGFMVKGLEYRI